MYRDGDDNYLVWGGESDEAKAQRQNAETLLGLRQQVLKWSLNAVVIKKEPAFLAFV